jgi:hypothetical protein
MARVSGGILNNNQQEKNKELEMKRTFSRIFTMAGFLMLLGAAVGNAQSPALLSATIPFEFKVLDQSLPAGNYTINFARTENKSLIWIKNQDSSRVVNVVTFANKPQKIQINPYLVFHQYGDEYFLAQVWTAHDPEARQIVTSQAEKEVMQSSAKENAQNRLSSKLVMIAAR